MATIYDDVADLQTRMTTAETDIDNLQTAMGAIPTMAGTALTEGADILTLPVGDYYSPSMTISESLLNKPYAKSSNCFVKVLPQNNGKRIVVFFYNTADTTCNNKIWYNFERDGSWTGWYTGYLSPDDSGWKTLPLADGIEVYSSGAAPQYRKIANKVYIKGAVKNVLTAGVIGTLPAGFRPVGTGHSYVQNTSYANGAQFARIVVQTNGEIEIESLTSGAAFGASKWFPIHTEFLID